MFDFVFFKAWDMGQGFVNFEKITVGIIVLSFIAAIGLTQL